MLVNPRNWSPRSPRAGYFGSPSSAKLTLDDVPWKRNRRIVLDEVRRQLARVDELEERSPRVERADHGRGVVLGAVGEGDADRAAALGHHLGDG